jgi:hypothetical protein
LVQGALGLVPATLPSLVWDAGLLVLSAIAGTAIALSIYRWRDG